MCDFAESACLPVLVEDEPTSSAEFVVLLFRLPLYCDLKQVLVCKRMHRYPKMFAQ
jgi:hypothetical protein